MTAICRTDRNKHKLTWGGTRRPQVSLRRPQVRVRSFLLAHHEVSSVGRTEVKATGAALRIHGAILSQLDA